MLQKREREKEGGQAAIEAQRTEWALLGTKAMGEGTCLPATFHATQDPSHTKQTSNTNKKIIRMTIINIISFLKKPKRKPSASPEK